jgi:hypothetical protein
MLRTACIAIGLLIIIPFLGLRMYGPSNGRKRLKAYFGSTFAANSVARHQFVWAGIGDTIDFWRLKTVDANKCQQVIQRFNLKPIRHEGTFSLMEPPSWWPKSTELHSVFEADDGWGGHIELWVPKEGSIVYLFKFTE